MQTRLGRRQAVMGLGALAATGLAGGTARGAGTLGDEIARKIKGMRLPSDTALKVLIPNGSAANLAPVTARFAEATGVRVAISEADVDDINARIALDWLSDDMNYDVALPATFGLPDLVAAGALLPIDDWVSRHEPDGFGSGNLYRIGDSFDGRQFGYQTDGDAYMMFYNTSFWNDSSDRNAYEDRFGEPLGIPTTWQALDRQLEWFHRPGDGKIGGLLFRGNGYVAWEWWVRFHAKGGWPLDKDMSPLVAGDRGVEALEEMIRATDFLDESVHYVGLFDNWKRYSQGDVYANIGWGGSQKYFNGPHSKVRDTLAFGPTPGGRVNGELLVTPYFNWGWTYTVTATASQPELAYLFTLFAVSPEISMQAVAQPDGFFDPFRVEHYDDPAICDAYSREFLNEHFFSMKHAIPDLYLAGQSQYMAALNTWVQRAIDREISSRDALRFVEQKWNLITLRLGRDEQIRRWADLRRKYPTDVRERLNFAT